MLYRLTITEEHAPFADRPTIRIDLDTIGGGAHRRHTISAMTRGEHGVFLNEQGERVRVSRDDAAILQRLAAMLSDLASEVKA